MAKLSRAKGCLLGVGVTVALLGLTEGVLRATGFENPPPDMPILIWNPDEDELMATGEYLFEVDEHSLWGLRPGAVIQFAERDKIDGPPEYVNAKGFRGPEIPLARTPGVMRIATLGDSSTFGVGVHFEETWSAQLVQRLAEQGVKAEVIDGGVDGFTVRQGLERYVHKIRPYRPDVVVAAFGAVNEHWYSEETDDTKMRRLAESRSWRSSAARWIRNNVRLIQGLSWLKDKDATERFLREADKKRQVAQYLAPHAGQSDWPFERRVLLDEFKARYVDLQAEVERDGTRLVVIAMPRRPAAEEQFPVLREYTRAVFQFAAEQNLQVISAHARFRYAERNGDPTPSWFIGDYWHPSPTGHKRISEWVAPLILEQGRSRGRDHAIDFLK